MTEKRQPTYDLAAFKAAFSRMDVYHVPSAVGVLYIKFTADVLTEFLMLSFKEKDHEG